MAQRKEHLVNEYSWNWSVVVEYWPAFLNGAIVSVLLTLFVVSVGTLVGVLVGVGMSTRKSVLRPLRWFLTVYVEILRALPVLVLLIWMHYVAPASTGWLYSFLSMTSEAISGVVGGMGRAVLASIASRPFASAAVALSLNLSAFVADIVRSEIAGTPSALIDAAKSLGMSPSMALRRVILPEVARRSLPALVALYITMFKFTTLAAFIGCNELMNVTFTAGNSSYRYLELYTCLAIVYLMILIPATYAAKRIEKSQWLLRRS